MKRSRILLFGLALLALPARAAPLQAPEPPGVKAEVPEKRLDAYVEEEMARRHVPGLSLAVVRNGKLVLARGYGKANVEHSIPARPGTVYELASVTKQFTAAAVMLLVEDGKVALDEPAAKYLADTPAAWKDVTVRHLLTHTSGIPSYTNQPAFGQFPRRDYTKAEIVSLVSGLPLEFQPGERFAYNNTGYFLLGMLIEKVSGREYEAFLRERIFKPLEMTSTRLNDRREVIPNRAAGYSWQGRLRNAEYVSTTQPFSAGGLLSTVEDMAKWDAALAGEKLLKPASLRQMWTSMNLKDGKPAGYGFGWAVQDVNGHRMVAHGGGIPGFSTQISRFVDDRLTVIVLANLEGGAAAALARGVAALYVPALAQPVAREIEDPDPATTARLKALLQSLAAGKPDTALFTEAARKALFPDGAKEAGEFLARLGPLKSLALVTLQDQGVLRTLRYRALFGDTTLFVTFALDKEGKIAGVGLNPE